MHKKPIPPRMVKNNCGFCHNDFLGVPRKSYCPNCEYIVTTCEHPLCFNLIQRKRSRMDSQTSKHLTCSANCASYFAANKIKELQLRVSPPIKTKLCQNCHTEFKGYPKKRYCAECEYVYTVCDHPLCHNLIKIKRINFNIYEHTCCSTACSTYFAGILCYRPLEPYKTLLEDKRSATTKRRWRKITNGGDYTKDEWDALCKFYDYKCLCCGKETRLTADHIIPLSMGGTSNIDNIQPLCLSCNARKNNKEIDYRTVIFSNPIGPKPKRIVSTSAKVCSRCKEEKPMSEFQRRTLSITGYASHCKKCDSITRRRKRKEQTKEQKDIEKQRQKDSYSRHKEQIKIKRKDHYYTNLPTQPINQYNRIAQLSLDL